MAKDSTEKSIMPFANSPAKVPYPVIITGPIENYDRFNFLKPKIQNNAIYKINFGGKWWKKALPAYSNVKSRKMASLA